MITNSQRAAKLGAIVLTKDLGRGIFRGVAYSVEPDDHCSGDYVLGSVILTMFGPTRHGVRQKVQRVLESLHRHQSKCFH